MGVVFRYDPGNDNMTKLKDVPESNVLARIEGCWQDKVYFSIPGNSEKHLLVDIAPLFPVAKLVPSEDQQLPNESRKYWSDVTKAILDKQYALATRLKHELEESQREKAAARRERNGKSGNPASSS